MKNDNFHIFFFAVLEANLNLPALQQNKTTRLRLFPWNRYVLQNPDRERTNQSAQIYLRLALPYNKTRYLWHVMLHRRIFLRIVRVKATMSDVKKKKKKESQEVFESLTRYECT